MTTYRGKILYTSRQPERMGAERGREYFVLTHQEDGVSALHARCEIDDEPAVARDVMATFETRTGQPIGAAIRLSVGGEFEGAGAFEFTDTRAVCTSRNVRDGHVRQELEHPDCTWFGHHAIIGDGTLVNLIPEGASPGIYPVNALMSSPDHRGATGPKLFPLAFSIVFEAIESVTTPAGTFETKRFSVTDTQDLPEEHPPYRIWTDAQTGIFVQGGVEGYMQTWYELVELSLA